VVQLNPIEEQLCERSRWDFSDLSALYVNCTLKRSPAISNTRGLADRSIAIMERNGVAIEVVRAIDHEIATGVYPDMTGVAVADLARREVIRLHALQHLGYTVRPQADSAWLGEAGPGPSYLDPGSGGPDNDFTNRRTAGRPRLERRRGVRSAEDHAGQPASAAPSGSCATADGAGRVFRRRMRLRRWTTVNRDPGELTCRELVKLVTDYLEGALSEHDRLRFEDHLRGCEGCTTYLEQIRETIALAGQIDEESLDPAAREELLAAFRDWSRDP
jgi:Putative zinc-finger